MQFRFNLVAQSRRRRKVLADLAAMSDAHLDDIGLTRANVNAALSDKSFALCRPTRALC